MGSLVLILLPSARALMYAVLVLDRNGISPNRNSCMICGSLSVMTGAYWVGAILKLGVYSSESGNSTLKRFSSAWGFWVKRYRVHI